MKAAHKKNDNGLDEKRVLFFSLCMFLTIYAIFMAAVAYCKMNNICDEEGEANGGVFVGDTIVSMLCSLLGFPASLHTPKSEVSKRKVCYPSFKISHKISVII